VSFNSIYEIAGSGMQAQTTRLNTIASNLANANSASGTEEGAYKALRPVFESVFERLESQPGQRRGEVGGASVRISDIAVSTNEADKRFEPGNPISDEEGFVYYSNVNVVEEMADMMSASRSFQTSVDVISRANSMQQGLLQLGK
jgi:flagellar basal-body rod protein FlgC